jgi:hypothetical protein
MAGADGQRLALATRDGADRLVEVGVMSMPILAISSQTVAMARPRRSA